MSHAIAATPKVRHRGMTCPLPPAPTVSWHGDAALPTGCYRVSADGRRLAWSSKSASTGQTMRGAVTNAFVAAP
jgi:hypothetical protein